MFYKSNKGMAVRKKRGFTLIELLVVISIIGFLSTLAAVSLKNAREKSRDARRAADITQLRKALDLYYDKNAEYPPDPGAGALCASCIEGAENNAGWADMLDFIKVLPKDPTRQGTANGYRYRISNVNGRQSYTMLVRLEKNSNWCSVSTDPGHTTWNFSDGTNFPRCNFSQ